MNIFGRSGSVSLLSVKPPAVAGQFYPAAPDELRSQVRAFLADAAIDAPAPKAVIAPHAGYRYSGPIAGSAYARFARAAGTVRTVVLLGPAHRVALRGLAASSAGLFATPLGDIEVDQAAVTSRARASPGSPSRRRVRAGAQSRGPSTVPRGVLPPRPAGPATGRRNPRRPRSSRSSSCSGGDRKPSS